jgi:hypothetical protein
MLKALELCRCFPGRVLPVAVPPSMASTTSSMLAQGAAPKIISRADSAPPQRKEVRSATGGRLCVFSTRVCGVGRVSIRGRKAARVCV